MDRQHCDEHYTSALVRDVENGSVGVELFRTRRDTKSKAAQVLFWDAAGYFYLETFSGEVPVEVVEELIAEAKAAVKLR